MRPLAHDHCESERANEDGSLRTRVKSLLMVKRAPARRRPRKAKPRTKGLIPAECRLDQSSAAAAEVVEAIEGWWLTNGEEWMLVFAPRPPSIGPGKQPSRPEAGRGRLARAHAG